ncbi:hypothetical protein INT43_006668 [Umbelopsis isabellina]|uniref:Ribosome maturation protein SDO1/SBDS N-terminal domain-containing protein n=1 Tax=Mortierella isabellina TaxID=91625 RepID=A0A8H7Q1M8_MORIS|nr:hypothetical protein INT43_006668 [Umbelopsis isabellina]
MPEGTPVRVTYKVNGEEFFVFADHEALEKWQKDKTIPLVEVAASFEVLHIPNGGNTGEAVRPSKGELESAFNTSNSDDIVKKILSEGEVKGSVHVDKGNAYGLGGNKGHE